MTVKSVGHANDPATVSAARSPTGKDPGVSFGGFVIGTAGRQGPLAQIASGGVGDDHADGPEFPDRTWGSLPTARRIDSGGRR